jgi:hypothetical protein
MCIAHGGGRRCEVTGCSKSAQGRGGTYCTINRLYSAIIVLTDINSTDTVLHVTDDFFAQRTKFAMGSAHRMLSTHCTPTQHAHTACSHTVPTHHTTGKCKVCSHTHTTPHPHHTTPHHRQVQGMLTHRTHTHHTHTTPTPQASARYAHTPYPHPHPTTGKCKVCSHTVPTHHRQVQGTRHLPRWRSPPSSRAPPPLSLALTLPVQ